ncbi:SH3 domain-containing protein [Acidovorax sp.]|uniref:SH3 domain-containing protein n=1 Tax=Acidovorax sp. TaxID=1872122 RepID=UPI00262814EA|nr:SH3 domain-containing protein [Acidovorax sp.]
MKWLHCRALAAWLACAALALLAGAAQAQDAAVVKRATQLRDSPAETGASVAPLEANTVVTRSSERKGPWTKVSTPQGATGWVHMFDLGPQSGAAAASNNAATGGLRSLGGLFGGNSGNTTATSTVGIRGLGAEDIAKAQPNPAAVSQAEGLRVNADQARQFASNAALQPRTVPPLAEPPRPSSSSGGSGAAGSSNNPSDPNFSPN